MSGTDRANLIAVFASVHHVLGAERAFHAVGLWCDLVPTPRDLSSDCGLALAFRTIDRDAADRVFESAPARPTGIYRPEGDGYAHVPARPAE